MTIVRLTGLAHSEWDEVKDVIGPNNMVWVVHESEYDKPEGRAYKVFYAGKSIGYLPLVSTLRQYYTEAYDDEQKCRVSEWGEATKTVREWLDSKVKYQFENEWTAKVWQVLYKGDRGYNFKDGEPCQVSIVFEL